MKKNKIILLLVIISFFISCKSQKLIKIQILPGSSDPFINELISLNAEEYDETNGKILISYDNLIQLETQMENVLNTKLFNITNYELCKSNNADYLYYYFEINNNELQLKSKESYSLKYDPANPKAIKNGPEIGYYKAPQLNIQDEIISLVNQNSFYKIFASTIKKSNKNFQIDEEKYSLLIQTILRTIN